MSEARPLRLVLASHNAGKLAELQSLFAPLPLGLVAQPQLGLAEAEEPHATFIENAMAKARHAASATGQAALADDSGLCGGAPGVISAHYASVELLPGEREVQRRQQDAANNALLLQHMQGVTARRASFVCTLVALRTADDPQPLVATGRWWGQLLEQPEGAGGFGYDPLLYISALGATVADLSRELKNTHSHRALACRQMLQLMREAWALA
jgi:XTP/dITP diphosphohydrolase